MEKLRILALIFTTLSVAVTENILDSDKSLSQLENILADYKREKEENDAIHRTDAGSLDPIMSDDFKPRMHSKLKMKDFDTRAEKKTPIKARYRLVDFKKRVASTKEESISHVSDTKEEKEAKKKEIDLGLLRDEIKPRVPSKSNLETSAARDAEQQEKRISSLAEQDMPKRHLSHLKRVAKKEKEPVKVENKTKEEKAAEKEKKPALVVDYKPFQNAEELEQQAEKVMRFLKQHPCPTPKESFYNVTVHTANKTLAGTTSKVYIALYGSLYNQRQSTGKFRLTSGNENNSNEFLTGRVDSFVVKASFVGIVNRITVEHDNSGFYPDWNLDKIVVNDLKLGTTHTFPCNCELSGFDNTKVIPPV